jgi:hypothetical protein
MMVQYVRPEHIPDVWLDIKPLIDLTEDEDNDTVSVYNELISGHRHLWMVSQDEQVTAAMTTSFVIYPTSGKMCRVETLAGKDFSSKLLSYLPKIEEWAKLNDCVAMDIFGRKGFEKALKPYGYDFNCVLLRKRL